MRTYTKTILRGGLLSLFILFALFFSAGNCAAAEGTGYENYGSYEQAVAQLRAQLVERTEHITVHFRSESEMPANYYTDMFYDDALAHTGVPKEGDYIRYNLSGCIYSSSHTTGDDGAYYYTATFYPEWLSTAEMEAEVDSAVAALLDELNLYGESEYKKIRGVYDYICEYIKYDYENEYIDSYTRKYTTYAAIIDKIAVCQGYASLYYRLMLELGVDCRVITGTAGGENHGWNIVRLGDVYYNMDCTWDAGLTVYYRYFLCTEGNFAGHTRSSRFTSVEFTAAYPMATLPYVEHVAASGTAGSLEWILDGDTGILTITGNGAIPNYRSLNAPWYPYADNISGIVIEEGVTAVGDYAFKRCKYASTALLPSTLTRIGQYSFDNCRSIKEITLPEGLKTLDTHAFSECTALTGIVIPGTVTTFGTGIFSNCYNLATVTFAEGMKTIPSSMFYNSDGLTSVTFPSTLTTIQNTAFRDCDKLRTVTIPAHVTSIGYATFANCKNLQNIYVDDANPNYTDISGVLYNKAGDTLITYPAGRYGSYTVPDGTKTIGDAAFADAVWLTGVSVPDSVTVYGEYAFTWCERLTSVVVGPNVTSVGEYSFGFCDRLKTVRFENPNTSVGYACFSNCRALTDISLPANLKSLGSSTFWQCDALQSITFPQTLTSIGSGCFQDCNLIEEITLPASVTSIDSTAFRTMPKLKEVTVNGNIRNLGRRSFAGCSALRFIHFDGTLAGVDSTAFQECSSLTAVYFSNASAAGSASSATALGGLCASARSVAVPQGTTGISSYLTGKLSRSETIFYEGCSYTLYSDHSHSWSSTGSTDDGHDLTRSYYCSTCMAKKQVLTVTHSNTNGICSVCGEDSAVLTENAGSVTLSLPGLEEGARVLAGFYSEGRMLSCLPLSFSGDIAVFDAVDGADLRVFVLSESWLPLRGVIEK